MSSSFNHEMLAPLRCVIQITKNLMPKIKEDTHKFEMLVI